MERGQELEIGALARARTEALEATAKTVLLRSGLIEWNEPLWGVERLASQLVQGFLSDLDGHGSISQ